MTETIVVQERGRTIAYSFDDMLKYHGPGSPGGVANAFKVLQRALPQLSPGEPPQRREIFVRTSFGGPGARDGFEAVTRAVSGERFAVDPALARPERGAEPALEVQPMPEPAPPPEPEPEAEPPPQPAWHPATTALPPSEPRPEPQTPAVPQPWKPVPLEHLPPRANRRPQSGSPPPPGTLFGHGEVKPSKPDEDEG